MPSVLAAKPSACWQLSPARAGSAQYIIVSKLPKERAAQVRALPRPYNAPVLVAQARANRERIDALASPTQVNTACAAG